MASGSRVVIGGVDTHGEIHHAAVIDATGKVLGSGRFDASPRGYRELSGWLSSHGALAAIGVEGTGSYGAGLCRHLLSLGMRVVEVDRPDRKARRSRGKSDPADAESAARSVLAGVASTAPKDRTGVVESVRCLRNARSGAVKARTAAINALRAAVVTAPDELRGSLDGLGTCDLVKVCGRMRPDRSRLCDPVDGAKLAMRVIARRIEALEQEIDELDAELSGLVGSFAPATLSLLGIGVDHAGQLLVTAGQDPGRLGSEAAFARVCGVAPMPASSGRIQRHRLNRGGDRQANRALHMAVIVRMRRCPRTRRYVARRTAEGLSKPEIIRCLKRYLAREVYHALMADLRGSKGLDAI